MLPDLRRQEVELGGVVPGKARAVVAVVDVALVARLAVDALEHDGRVGVVPVVVIEHDPHPRIGRQVRPGVGVGGERRLGQGQEPLRVLDDPARIDAHVVGHHVAGQPDAPRPRPVPQVRVGRLAPEVVRDPVVVEGIGRGDGVGVAAHPLDPLRRHRALPQPDQPQARHPPARQGVELLVRDRVERAQLAPVATGQLVEPDVRALGHEHHARHPVRIAREGLRLIGDDGRSERRHVRRQVLAPAATTEAQVQAALLLGKDADRDVQPADDRIEVGPEDRGPVLPDVAQLAGQRGGHAPGRRSQQLDERRPRPVRELQPVARGEPGLEAGGQVVVARPVAEDPVVDQLAQRSEGRVLVGDADQEQLLEAVDGRLGLRPDAREGRREAIEDEVGVGLPESAADVAERAGHRARAERLEPSGQQVRDLVEQPQRHDLAGPDRGRARPAGPSSSARRGAGSRRGRRRRGRHGRSGGRHRSRGARAPSGEYGTRALARRMARALGVRQAPSASVGRSAAACSIARRSSSSPDGSNS